MAADQETGTPSSGTAPPAADGEKGEGETLLSYAQEPPPSAAARQRSPVVQVVTWLPAILSLVALVVILYAMQDTFFSQGSEILEPRPDAVFGATIGQEELQSAKQEMQKLRNQLRMAAKQTRNFQDAAKVSQAQVAKLQAALAKAQAQPGTQSLVRGVDGVGNDAQLATLLGVHAQLRRECGKGKPASTTEACSQARAVLRSALTQAEEQYRINLQHRNAMDGGVLMTSDHIRPARLKEAILVPTWPCPLEGRFGLWGEGGKWVCLVHTGVTQDPVTFSIGSKGDTSFEGDMYKRLNATIHTLDPTLDKATQARMRAIPYLTFHDAGLSGKHYVEKTRAIFPPRFRNAVLLTVPQLLKTCGVRYIDIFKIDCEGCEFGVVEDMVELYNRNTVPFGQIQMEIHFLSKVINARNLVARLESLGYRMFQAEANGFYPDGYEVAFIHESLTRV